MIELLTILEEIDFVSYADDNTPFLSEVTFENVVNSQGSFPVSLFKWFSNKQIKIYPHKCHLLMNVNSPATIGTGE